MSLEVLCFFVLILVNLLCSFDLVKQLKVCGERWHVFWICQSENLSRRSSDFILGNPWTCPLCCHCWIMFPLLRLRLQRRLTCWGLVDWQLTDWFCWSSLTLAWLIAFLLWLSSFGHFSWCFRCPRSLRVSWVHQRYDPLSLYVDVPIVMVMSFLWIHHLPCPFSSSTAVLVQVRNLCLLFWRCFIQ